MAPPSGTDAALARLPLQIGTTATWSAGRAALALFPGLAIVGLGIDVAVSATPFALGTLLAALLCASPGVLLVVYAGMHLYAAHKTRASDLLFFQDGLAVDGGRLHGRRIPWSELSAPYAEIEDTTAKRLTLLRIFLFILSLSSRGSRVVSPVAPVRIWKLYILHRGQRRLIAETERPIESASMSAAASSVCAVVEGQKYVAQAPAVAARILTCGSCGAPAVPDDLPSVVCAFCRQPVPLPAEVRGQAAATKALAQSRITTTQMIAKLRAQPHATRTNAWLLIVSLFMFGAWPIGWGLIAYRVLGDGFQATDALCLMLPLAAVLGGFFIARARLADRGALQLLTLGFGALSPRQAGEPSRCRRCQGPLPSAGLGGVTQCLYCAAENIVGLDLRPSVDPARAEQHTFDDALKKRAKEKLLWTALTVVAAIALVGWIGGTAAYIANMGDEGPPPAPPPPPPRATSPALDTPAPTHTALPAPSAPQAPLLPKVNPKKPKK